jgi:hypothetical protein
LLNFVIINEFFFFEVWILVWQKWKLCDFSFVFSSRFYFDFFLLCSSAIFYLIFSVLLNSPRRRIARRIQKNKQINACTI